MIEIHYKSDAENHHTLVTIIMTILHEKSKLKLQLCAEFSQKY